MGLIKRTRIIVILLAGLVSPATPGLALAQPGSALQFLQTRHREVEQILRRTPQADTQQDRQNGQLTRALNALIDFRELSRRALSRHWENRSEAERNEFVTLRT